MSLSTIQDAFQALASGDPDRISAVLTEDAGWLSPPGNAVAVALETTHHMVGGAAIVQFFAEDLPRLFADGLVHRVRQYVDTARGHRMAFGGPPRQAAPVR